MKYMKHKILIASDIHGSATYCKQLLARFDESGAEKLVLLGDILYHGPRNDLPDGYAPKQVIAMLSEYKDEIVAVRGNCDAEVDAMVLPFPVMADYAVLFFGNRVLYLTHGHLFSPEAPINMRKGEIMISGHTHIPLRCECDGKIYLNPGSVSIPKNGSPHSYMLAESDGEDVTFGWYTLDGEKFEA